MRALRTIFVSQVLLFTRDRVAVLLTLLLPLLLGGFFGYIFGPSGSTPLRISVVNNDAGPVGVSVVEGIEERRGSELTVSTDSAKDAEDKIRKGDTDLVIAVPSDFSAKVAAKTPTSLTATVNSGQGGNGAVALLAARALVQEVGAGLSGQSPAVTINERDLAERTPSLAEFYVPNFLAVSVLWLSIFATALPLVKYRQDGILRRIGIAPVSKGTFMVGVTLWRLTVGLVQSALFIAVSLFITGTSNSLQLPLLAAAVVLGNLVFTVMGYMIAGLSRSMASAEGIAQAFNFGFLFLSGVFFVPGMLPPAVERIADVIPLSYLADLFRQLLVGYPAQHLVWLDFAVLGGSGLIFGLVALRTWRWE